MAQELGEALTMDAWLNVIRDTEDLNSAQKRAVRRRLKLLQRLASAEGDLWQVVEPGAVTVFSLGGPWVSSQDPLPLVTALLIPKSQSPPRDEVRGQVGDADRTHPRLAPCLQP